MKNLKPILIREIIWLFGISVAAFLLAAFFGIVLKPVKTIYEPIMDELGQQQIYFMLLLYCLCFIGLYLARATVSVTRSLSAP